MRAFQLLHCVIHLWHHQQWTVTSTAEVKLASETRGWCVKIAVAVVIYVYVTRCFATLSWAHTQFASWVYHTVFYLYVTASQWKGREVIRVCISRESNSRKVQESKLYWSHISICDSLWAHDVNMNPWTGSLRMHIMACTGLMGCMRPANERRLCNSHRRSACTEWSLLAACSVPSAYMDRCQFIVNWTPRNILYSFKKTNLKILSVKRHFAPHQCVK